MTARHVAGLTAWLVVVALLVFGGNWAATPARPLYGAIGLIGGLALWSALSSFWSGSAELSFTELDRVLTYLGFFVAACLIAQTDEKRQRFAEGLAIAVTLVVLLGLASRLLPDLLTVTEPGSGPRLRYPLGYWNANGVMCGMAVVMLLWASRRASWAALRVLAAAAIPAVLLTLYFTYSRGGLLSLVAASVCLLALSKDRLWLGATLAVSLLAALPAVLAVQDRRELADNFGGAAMADQGLTVLIVLLGCIAVAVAAFAGLRRLEARDGRLTGRAVALSRHPGFLRGAAILGAVLVIGLAVAVGERAWNQFSTSDVYFPDRPEKHFSDLGGAGRHDLWRVATDSFAERPLQGWGAGTYEFAWERKRAIDLPVHDAHSLYLEALAELGVVGTVLVLATVGFLLAIALLAWRGASHPERDRYAAMLAVMLAFALGAAFDWFWEIAGLGAVFFLAAGVAVSARSSQVASSNFATWSRSNRSRYGLAIAGLATAWIAAIALVGPLLVEREIDASQRAAAKGDLTTAFERARTARSIEPWAASPYVQLGLLAELQGDYNGARTYLSHAIEREDRNWQIYFLRARVEGAAGNPTAEAADLESARELNPRAPELQPAGS